MPPGRVWGNSAGVAIDRDGKSVWFAERCGGRGNAGRGNGCALPENKSLDPILEFDTSGNLVKSFGAGMFHYPHGIWVDRNGNIWVADGNTSVGDARFIGNTVRQFSPDGELLMTLGTPGAVGKGPYLFSGVSAVAVAPNGDIFVADGHSPDQNNRIIKYDSHGKFLLEWGKSGSGPTDFNPPHGLAMDKEGRLYVADRINGAVKVFDENGKLLQVWDQFGLPNGVFVDKNDILYVADNNWTANPGFEVSGIRIASAKDGKLIANIPWGEDNTLEGVAVDDTGNVYGAFTNKPGSHRFMKE